MQPHNFAVTSSVRIQIYNPITKDPISTLSRFQKNAYGGTFSTNGQLVVCGDEDGYVKLFETTTRRNLRIFKGHKAGVRRTYFTKDKLHIASFSDDKTVRLWDIPLQECIHTFKEQHSDYVRAGCVSPVSPDILLSGGYDGKVKMYDTRTKSVVFEVNHESAVHSVLFLPTGGIFISSGGTHVNVWDAFAGGRLIARMSQHSRDVTCLTLASNGRRLLSGGLDRKVKIYDTSTYSTVHSLDFSNAVTSVCMSPNDETLVVGMNDGIVSVQRMDSNRQIKTIEKRNIPKKQQQSTTDQTVEDYKKNAEAKYNKHLRKFEYSKALETVFKPQCIKKTPHITVGVMSELMRRKGLERALIGQPDSFLIPFLVFLKSYMGDRRFIRTLIDVSNCVLNAYDDFSKLSGEVATKFMDLSKTLKREESLLFDCLKLQGAFDMLMSGAMVAEESSDIIEYGRELNKLKPSHMAEEELVIKVDD